ncbi:MAG: hypothetical protein Q7W16_02905 [Coriobacteriia bacterium]|nr:hypothetical protein [Coriobacteriia bacterium]
MIKRSLTVLAMAACLVAMTVGVAVAATPPYIDNSQCFECHAPAGTAVSIVDFNAAASVNRASACKKCHWEFAAPAAPSHPFHYATWNCSSCHFEMGTTNFYAVPKVYVPALDAYFFSAESALADKDTLHVIHSNPRWPASVVKNGRQCGSCHAAANCTACHENAVDRPTHEDHTWDAALGAYWPGTGPATTVFGAGTSVGAETERTLTTGLTCSNDTCHDIASGVSLPILVEDGNVAVKYVPAWGRSSTTGYTGNTYRISNALNATAEYRFTGQKVEFVTDRHPYRGKAEISIDGVVKTTVDLYAAVAEKQYVAFASDVLASGDHTITVKVTRTKNPLSRDYYVVVDAFRVFPKIAAELTRCTVCHSPASADYGSTDRKLDHGAPVVSHEPASSTSCTTGSGCHTTYTNIATGHAARGDSCSTCHENPVLTTVGHLPYKFDAGITKECQTCHNATLGDLGAKTGNPFTYTTPHGTKHTLTLAGSNYSNTTVSGCTNAGAGCHGASQVSTDIVTYHIDKTSCYSGACHSSGSKAGHTQPFTCQACHDGSYTNATNTSVLAQAAPAGHYGETTHTAVGMGGTVTGFAGGLTSAACTSCHSPVNSAGIDNLWYQHQALPGALNVTCSDCHNKNVYVTLEITGNWTNNTCADCHKVGVLDTAIQHGSTASPFTGTSSLGNCAQSGCHASMDLHYLHRGNGAPDPACSVCHSYSAQAAHPTQTTCGTGNACHTDKTLSNHGVKHTLTLTGSNYADGSGQGVATGCTNSGAGCHGTSASTNIADYHPTSGCTSGPCHTSGDIGSHKEPFVCGDCHDGTYAGARDTTALADIAPVGHYGETTHTASAGLGNVQTQGGSAAETCSVCHDLSLKDAHDGIETPTKGTIVTCGECHNYNAAVSQEVTATSWTTNACSDCHNATDIPVSVQHAPNVLTVVPATGSAGCSSSGRNCHNSSDLHFIHRNEAAGCDLAGCHDAANKNIRPTVTTCGQATGCHLSSAFTPTNHNGRTGDESTHTASAAQAADTSFATTRCDACHGMTLNAEHVLATTYLPGTGTSCEKCHNRADSDAAIAGTWLASRTGNTTASCATCHGIGTIPARHADASSTAHSSPTSAGCGNTGTGCHNSNDLSQVGVTNVVNTKIHADCLTCHDKAGVATWTTPGQGNMKWNPTLDTCGGSECHTSGFYNPSAGATQYQHRIGRADAVTGIDTDHHLTTAGMSSTITSGTATAACSACHSSTMVASHAGKAAATCVGCHNSSGTSGLLIHADDVVKSGWTTKTCAQCHGTSGNAYHDTYTAAAHTGDDGANTCGSRNCHGTYNLVALHSKQAGGCQFSGCHDTKDARPTRKTCGSAGAGTPCHATYTNTTGHRSNTITGDESTHTASAAQAADTTYASTRCDACHGMTLTAEHGLSTTYLPGTGTTCEDCHNRAGSDAAIAGTWAASRTGNTTASCATCHGVTSGGDTIPARHTDASSTAHTKDANAAVGCGASGAGCHPTNDYSQVGVPTTAANIHTDCLTCHDKAGSATYLGNGSNMKYGTTLILCGAATGCHLNTQYTAASHNGYGGLADGDDGTHHTANAFTKATYPESGIGVYSDSKECNTCHSDKLKTSHATVSGSSGVVTCIECHNGTGSINVTATVAQSEVKASWTTDKCTDCHASARTHTTFKTGAGYNANHTATQNAGCVGSGNGCHGTGPTGTAVAPAGELSQLHPNDGCNASSGTSGTSCHGVNKPMAAIGKTCGTGSNCHSSFTTTAGHAAGTITGNESTHTVTAASMDAVADATYTNDVQCKNCHSSGMRTAHTTSTVTMESANTWPLAQAPYCTQCHNATTPDNATLVIKTTTWDHTCDSCHVTNGNGRHTHYTATLHNSAPGSGCAQGTCHGGITNVRAIHDRVTSGCTATGTDDQGWAGGCHSLEKEMPATMPGCGVGTAGNCHINHTGSNHGASSGGVSCYNCHSAYQSNMEDGTGTKTGATRTLSFHHVLGSATAEGDSAFSATTYPGPGTDVYCLSCHVDHDKFNATKAANLRATSASGTALASSSDFSTTSPYGVCANCHSVERARDNANQKTETTSTRTPAILGAEYSVSAHQYVVTSTFGAGNTFNANCVKCHNDEQTEAYQNSTYKFGLHWSWQRRILAAMGVTLTEPPHEEDNCYKCHSLAADGFKANDNLDWYGIAAMSAASQNIYDLIQLGVAGTTTSTNELYFRPTTDVSPAEPMPNQHYTGDTFNGGTWVGRTMAPGASSVANETKSQATNVNGTARWRMVTFTSPVVATPVSIGAGTWTVNLMAGESSTSQNAYIRYFIYKWNAADTIGTSVVPVATGAAELPTTAAVQTLNLAGSAVTLAAGDKVSIDLVLETRATSTNSYTGSFAWGSGAASRLTMPTSVTFTWSTPAAFTHKVESYNGVHRPSPTDETQAQISANKHVECADCHDVHAARKVSHTGGGATGNAIGTSSPLLGVSGQQFAKGTSTNWSLTGSSFTWTTAATTEYAICFKCHSSANSNYATWGGAGAASWTNQALEFNPSNRSFHPVVAALGSAGSGSSALQAADMRIAGTAANGQAYGGWTAVGAQTMYCSDCHAQSSIGSLGPHGSAVKWMLKGPNQAWPYTTAAGNGTSSGTYRQYSTRDNDLDSTNGLFCNNCHVLNGNEHTRNAHGVACVNCHIRVPHGGKVSRLMNSGPQANVPARYEGDGNGTPASTSIIITSFTKATGTYSSSNCGVTGCSSHGSAASEAW